jgi:hypothetical protein
LAGVAHWLSDVHAVRHAVPFGLQVKSPHELVVAAAQLPAALQPPRVVKVALAQLAVRHVTASPG